MAKADLGEKQTCPNCSAKFYDLRKRPALCPKCGTSFDPTEEVVRLKRVRSRNPNFDRAYDDEAAAEVETVADEDEEEAIEDAPELDAEDVEEVVAEDDDAAGPTTSDELPPGFSEAEEDVLDDDESVADDVPLLEDEEEFDEEELGGLPDADDDEEVGR